MSFLLPSLLWIGGLLLAATLAVHLLNLRRQRPTPWAAMDFLLESERVNRTWINLRQWLLLALRLAAIALVVFWLARPQLERFNIAAMANQRVTHLVVLDDSYSMSDGGARSDAWGDALAAVDRIIKAASEGGNQEVVVFRTSEVLGEPAPSHAAQGVELAQLATQVSGWAPTETAATLLPAIEASTRAAQAAPSGAQRVAYIVTDARRRDLRPVEDVTRALQSLQDAGASVRFVTCVRAQHENLTLSGLRVLPGPQAAGVELAMELSVTNNGPARATGVLVELQRDGAPSPAVELGAIQRGETVTRRFPMLFREPGAHRVVARLPPDAVETDNTRFLSLATAPEREVLVIDGSADGQEGLAFAAALRPTDSLNTGWRPVVMRPRRADGLTSFERFAAVCVLDAPRLSAATAEALAAYVRSGGGLLISVGPGAERDFYNQSLLGESDRALAPIVLTRPIKPPARDAAEEGDVLVSDHPVFRVFAGERNSFLNLVSVDYLYGAELLDGPPTLETLATHRSGAPLLMEAAPGEGRLMVMLTTVAQGGLSDGGWSNLSALPVFPVLALEMTAYVAHPRLEPPALGVGERWSLAASARSDATVRISRAEPDGARTTVSEGSGADLATLPGPATAGFYRIDEISAAGAAGVDLAANVDPAEGDLTLADRDDLSRALAQVGVPLETAVALSADRGDDGPSSLMPMLGVLAIALLLGEQALAIASSYHQPIARGEAA